MACDHQSVYDALLRLFPREEENGRLKEPYAWLFGPQSRPESQNCAVLYPPSTTTYAGYPLHLNDSVPSWSPAVFERIKPSIRHVCDRKRWGCYDVISWGQFAEALGLKSEMPQRSLS